MGGNDMIDRESARQRAEALVARMTLEEKASQLRYDAPAIERLGVPAYNWWNEALHGVARAGTATVFPQAIGLAAMFDEDFLREMGGDGILLWSPSGTRERGLELIKIAERCLDRD